MGGKLPHDIYKEMPLHSPDTVVEMQQVQGVVHRLRTKLLSEFPEDSVGYLSFWNKTLSLRDLVSLMLVCCQDVDSEYPNSASLLQLAKNRCHSPHQCLNHCHCYPIIQVMSY